MSKLAPAAAVLFLACAGAPANNTAPDATGEPTSAPVAEPARPGDAAPANKCVQEGGSCTPLVAANVCTRSEKGTEWGCGENNHCCFN